MSNSVSVIGLGLMGSALARAQLRAGRAVTVWNRSAARAEPLAKEGASVAPSFAAAVAASPVAVVCVLDYEVTHALFADPALRDGLRGKTIVQLTSGTASDARKLESALRPLGAETVDGAILAYPKDVGGPQTTILYSGPKPIFDRVEPLLRAFGGQTMHVGEAIGAAATLDAALLSFYYGSTLAFLHGVALTESEGVPREIFLAAAPAIVALTADTVRVAGDQITRGDYRGEQATMEIHAAAVRHLLRMSRENRVGPEILEVVLRFFERAIERGHGAEEIASVVEGIRAPKR
jgi:3-hydroxyisobutyrate dehydrogenase-like beta-hydroxyacid dehydrogenase